MEKVLDIEGMSCGNCVGHVTKALEALDGVSSVDVNLEAGKATVETSTDISDDVFRQTITDAGYTVTAIN